MKLNEAIEAFEIERRERQNLARDYEKAHAEILRLRRGIEGLAIRAADMIVPDPLKRVASFIKFTDELYTLLHPHRNEEEE